MNSLMQLSRALMEAKQEKETAVAQALIEAKTVRLENAADAKQQELLKVCISCCLLKCTDSRFSQ